MTCFIYFYLNKIRSFETAKGWLVFSSLFFYGWWDVSYLPLILGSILFNYFVGNALFSNSNFSSGRPFPRKFILIFGIVSNLSLLGYFKYVDFFVENINIAWEAQINLLDLTLPLAISFFTFQQISYLVDSYERKTKENDFLNYAVFVTFFPQLIAGPIVHHREMMPQFGDTKNKVINYPNIAAGLFVFSIGLFKKTVLADTFAVWASNGFDVAKSLNLFEAWATSLSYTFQLYFDFSGYADMAIGAALLFNINLPINFNSPYKAKNLQEFWRRWHMTLFRFLKEYVYIPLGGNRGSSMRTYNNLLITFLVGGIWHGAGWTFVFWGFLHGMGVVINRMWILMSIKLPEWMAWFITFNFVNIGWVFFRAKEWEDAVKVLKAMFSLDNIVLPRMLKNKFLFLDAYGVEFGSFVANIQGSIYTPGWLIIGLLIVLLFESSNKKVKSLKLNSINLLFCVGLFVMGVISINKVSEFLYFNF